MKRDGGVPKVLLVDDSPSRCERLANALADRGMAVVTARSAEEALEQLERARGVGIPDLVVARLELSGMDGWELRDAMKREQRLRDVTVLLYSPDIPEVGGGGVHELEEVPAAIENAIELTRALREHGRRRGRGNDEDGREGP